MSSDNVVVTGGPMRGLKMQASRKTLVPRARPTYSRAKSMASLSSFRTTSMMDTKAARSARILIKKQQQNILDLDHHQSFHSKNKPLARSVSERMGRGGALGGDVIGEGSTGTNMVTLEKHEEELEKEEEESSNIDFFTSHDYNSVSEYSSSLDSFCDADEDSIADQDFMEKHLGSSIDSGNDRDEPIDEANMDLAASDDEVDDGKPIPGFENVDDDDIMGEDEFDLATEERKPAVVAEEE